MVKRMGGRRVRKALEHLRECEKLEAIHEVRKDIKQLRALLRLVREAMPKSEYRSCSRLLRKAGKKLGVARDAHVKLNALATLVAHYAGEVPPRALATIRGLLAADCRKEQLRLSQTRAPKKVCRLLRALCRDDDSFRIKKSGWAALGPGIQRSYGRGRCAYALAHKTGKAEDFHEWRKRAKDLYYQIGLLEPIWPEQLGAAEAELKNLTECLGDDHDLFLLTEPSATKRFNAQAPHEAAALGRLVAKRQRDLRACALALGMTFYREQPSIFCNRLGQYWHRWRHKSKGTSVAA
ncbi:MAG TPA: CHAD domain-containing protein [Verrucomicrobiae bacterium]|nr:CHAD domain-containing protein [Verrucomicrobiae bacterium]